MYSTNTPTGSVRSVLTHIKLNTVLSLGKLYANCPQTFQLNFMPDLPLPRHKIFSILSELPRKNNSSLSPFQKDPTDFEITRARQLSAMFESSWIFEPLRRFVCQRRESSWCDIKLCLKSWNWMILSNQEFTPYFSHGKDPGLKMSKMSWVSDFRIWPLSLGDGV